MDNTICNDKKINVLVCATTQDEQITIETTIIGGQSIWQAIENSNIRKKLNYNISEDNIGVFSQRTNRHYQPKQGDRIEIYRPLQITAQQLRQARALRKNKTCAHLIK